MDLTFRLTHFTPPNSFFHTFPEERHWLSARLKINLNFRKGNEWDKHVYRFIFDTGAYISIAPQILLDSLNIPVEFEGYLHGIVAKDECKLKVKVCKLNFKIVDDDGIESNQLTSWFAFHSMPKGPFLFGMNSLVEKIGIVKKSDSNAIILRV